MKKIYYYLPVAALALSATSCNGGKQTEGEIVKERKFDIANLDTTASKGSSFYEYATGGWTKANPLPDEYSRYGSFESLADKNKQQIKDLIEELGKSEHQQGNAGQLIGDLYTMGMDSTKLNKEGSQPIQEQLDEIKKAENVNDIIILTGKIRAYANSPFFSMYVYSDAKNSAINIVNIAQGGLGLGLRDYYLKKDSTTLAIQDGYKKLIETQFINTGYTPADAANVAKSIYKIETAIATAHYEKEFVRNRDLNYHKMNVSDLSSKVGKFDWNLFFESAQVKGFTELNVAQIKPVTEAIKLIQTLPIEETKAYLSWCVINASAAYLSDNFVDADFDFFGKQMSGKQAQEPRWKRTVGTIESQLGEAVGKIYVEKYFPAEAKERMLKLVANLQKSFDERITNLTWMSDETKTKAHEKLNAFTVKIGYPDKWKDYSSLEIKKDSYWANIVRSNQFDYKDMVERVGKPVDKTEWHMPPQMVNAYYNPSSNEICFPAGILQPPFFYLDADDAVNYGAIGVVIGHEMSHGFDDQGCKYDKEGNMINWWTDGDSKKFEERAQVLVDHFNAIEILPGLKANGSFTLGENIGDFGGLQVAYNAFTKTEEAQKETKIDAFTPQQRFFLSYAGLWAANIREQEIKRRTEVDVHSLGKWRVDGTLPHISAWYDAFGITETDSLFIPKEKRADIW